MRRVTLSVIVLLDHILCGAWGKKDLRSIRERSLHSIVRVHDQLLDHIWILVHLVVDLLPFQKGTQSVLILVRPLQ